MKWQPIETAPKDGTKVDLWASGERLTDFYFDGAEWVNDAVSMYHMGLYPWDITHWQPLPDPPDMSDD